MAATQDLSIDQGSTVKINYSVNQLTNPDSAYNANTNPYIPINLTNTTITMMARTTFDSPTPVLSFSNTNGDFTVANAAMGTFSLTIPPGTTSNLRFTGDSIDYVYDLELKDNGNVVTRAFEGTITVNREVTRP